MHLRPQNSYMARSHSVPARSSSRNPALDLLQLSDEKVEIEAAAVLNKNNINQIFESMWSLLLLACRDNKLVLVTYLLNHPDIDLSLSLGGFAIAEVVEKYLHVNDSDEKNSQRKMLLMLLSNKIFWDPNRLSKLHLPVFRFPENALNSDPVLQLLQDQVNYQLAEAVQGFTNKMSQAMYWQDKIATDFNKLGLQTIASNWQELAIQSALEGMDNEPRFYSLDPGQGGASIAATYIDLLKKIVDYYKNNYRHPAITSKQAFNAAIQLGNYALLNDKNDHIVILQDYFHDAKELGFIPLVQASAGMQAFLSAYTAYRGRGKIKKLEGRENRLLRKMDYIVSLGAAYRESSELARIELVNEQKNKHDLPAILISHYYLQNPATTPLIEPLRKLYGIDTPINYYEAYLDFERIGMRQRSLDSGQAFYAYLFSAVSQYRHILSLSEEIINNIGINELVYKALRTFDKMLPYYLQDNLSSRAHFEVFALLFDLMNRVNNGVMKAAILRVVLVFHQVLASANMPENKRNYIFRFIVNEMITAKLFEKKLYLNLIIDAFFVNVSKSRNKSVERYIFKQIKYIENLPSYQAIHQNLSYLINNRFVDYYQANLFGATLKEIKLCVQKIAAMKSYTENLQAKFPLEKYASVYYAMGHLSVDNQDKIAAFRQGIELGNMSCAIALTGLTPNICDIENLVVALNLAVNKALFPVDIVVLESIQEYVQSEPFQSVFQPLGEHGVYRKFKQVIELSVSLIEKSDNESVLINLVNNYNYLPALLGLLQLHSDDDHVRRTLYLSVRVIAELIYNSNLIAETYALSTLQINQLCELPLKYINEISNSHDKYVKFAKWCLYFIGPAAKISEQIVRNTSGKALNINTILIKCAASPCDQEENIHKGILQALELSDDDYNQLKSLNPVQEAFYQQISNRIVNKMYEMQHTQPKISTQPATFFKHANHESASSAVSHDSPIPKNI